MKLDKKGFTVIELILSFILVMFLAMSMFALVNNYKNKEQIEAVKRDLMKLQNTLTQDIYEDTITKKVEQISFCLDESGEVIKQCINIKFLDKSVKQLKVVETTDRVTDEGTTFDYNTFNIYYGGHKYKNPDPKFTKIVSDYILTSTVPEDNLEYGVIYHIKLRIEHQDIEDEYVIDVITTGVN